MGMGGTVTAKGLRDPVPVCCALSVVGTSRPGGAHSGREFIQLFPCTLFLAHSSFRQLTASRLLLSLHLAERIRLSPTKDLQSPLILALFQYTKMLHFAEVTGAPLQRKYE